MKNKLDRIEAHLRMLFEERLVSIISGALPEFSLLDNIIQVMQENIQEGIEGQVLAPDEFIITLPPDELTEWQAHQDILDEVAVSLHQIGLEEGFCFHQPPEISLKNSLNTSGRAWDISANFRLPKPALPNTTAMPQAEQIDVEGTVPENAFLVVGGKTNFKLEKELINLGRHSDNDLILDDPHVSRHHAQLRVINGSYVIFDAGSSSGLFLNGKQISQATLRAGDVIRLGVTNLIYIQDTTGETPTTAMPVDADEQDFESVDQ